MKTPQILLSLAALCLLPACPSDGGKTTDTSSDAYWCESISDAQQYSIVAGGGNSASGLVVGRLITDYGDNIHDPNIVGNLQFKLTSVSSGGASSLDTTDDYGDFQDMLGAGTWLLEASSSRSGLACTSSYQFEIVADKTTSICVQLSCS